MAWPRVEFKDAAGRTITNETIPIAVKEAQVEIAVSSLTNELTNESVSLIEEEFGTAKDKYASPVTTYTNPTIASLIKRLSFIGIARNRSSVAVAYRA